jgi:hypothetical protein
MEPSPTLLLAYVTGAGIVGVLLVFSRLYWRLRLEAWARSQGLTLLSFRGASAFEGPRRYWRSEQRNLFRVEVTDRAGVTLTGWVPFGARWGFDIGEPLSDVAWDSDDAGLGFINVRGRPLDAGEIAHQH